MKYRGCKGCTLVKPAHELRDGFCAECAPKTTANNSQNARPVPRDATADRLRGYLTRMATNIPGVWKFVDAFRRDRKNLGDWPSWCFMPLAGSYAIVSGNKEMDPKRLPEVGSLGALAAWRVTQGIYRYDATVLDALWETEVTGDIPEDILLALPEWCVYIETPGHTCQELPMVGFFAHLECDANDKRHELRLMFDTGETLVGCLPIHLGGGILDGINWALAEAKKQAKMRPEWDAVVGPQIVEQEARKMTDNFAPMVSVLLYLCSANAEMRDQSQRRPRPARPATTKTKDGARMFPPDQPTTWEVGFRIGATIRGALAQKPTKRGDGTHASPRPHVRRAHWHSFWTGEKAKPGIARQSERKLVLKWLPPTPVNVDDESEVIPTIHRVAR